jgi:hypothetical protein
MAVGAWDVVVYAVAIAAVVWILTPAIVFSLGMTRISNDVEAGTASVAPNGDDSDYERRFGQFAALGFQAAGKSRETCWFMNPMVWHWRSKFGSRWMATPDGKTSVAFYRLLAIEPVRFCVTTLFEGGGLVRSTCPGAGIGRDTETYFGTEYQNIEPAALLAKHRENVDSFSRRRARTAKSATLAEVTAEGAAQDTILVRKIGRSAYGAILSLFALPALAAPSFFSLRGTGWQRGALGVCIGAAIFAFFHLVVTPAQRRQRVMQSHAPRNPTPGAAP